MEQVWQIALSGNNARPSASATQMRDEGGGAATAFIAALDHTEREAGTTSRGTSGCRQ